MTFFIVGSSQTVMNGFFNCFLYRFDILLNKYTLFTYYANSKTRCKKLHH